MLPDTVLDLFRMVRAKLVTLALAAALALPLGLSANANPALAASVCYWGAERYDRVSLVTSTSVSWTGVVAFYPGYDCYGGLNTFFVAYDWEQIMWPDKGDHAWITAGVCDYLYGPNVCHSYGSDDYNIRAHCTVIGNDCVLTHTKYWNRTMPYHSTASVWSHFDNCPSPGNDLAQGSFLHEFWLHRTVTFGYC